MKEKTNSELIRDYYVREEEACADFRQFRYANATSKKKIKQDVRGRKKDEEMNDNDDDYTSFSTDEDDEPYIVKQEYGYFSIFFSVIQIFVLLVMMVECHVAPFRINPMLGPYPDALDYWGGKNAFKIIEENEWWRLITPIFLHAGVLHLVGNISIQIDTGAFFEREWGSAVWLIVYIVSAIGSSILSCCFMPNSISVGSSGAVMGLFGAKLAEIFCRSWESQESAQSRIAYEVRMEQLNNVLCAVLLVGLFSFVPYVDWAAHLGGLVAGIVIGLILFSTKIKSIGWVSLWLLVGMLLTIFLFAVALTFMYNMVEPSKDIENVCAYYQKYFDDYECNCQIN